MATIQDEITTAIGAHGMWKQRLYNLINAGKSDVSPPAFQSDQVCAFGRWLQGPSLDPNQKETEHYRRVVALHAQFHQEAGRIVELIQAGRKSDAAKALELGGTYHSASSALTMAMMQWKMSVV